MLELPFMKGSANTAFRQLNSVVISETMAKKFFGDDDPIGKALKVNNEQDYLVPGVFKALTRNSTYQFHWRMRLACIDHKQPWMTIGGANWVRPLVELEPNANVAAIN